MLNNKSKKQKKQKPFSVSKRIRLHSDGRALQFRMRAVVNAVDDVMDELRLHGSVARDVTLDGDRWVVRFTSKPGALTFFMLEIEVLENQGNPAACVLHRINVSPRSMDRVMDRLMERLLGPRSIPPSDASPPAGGSRFP